MKRSKASDRGIGSKEINSFSLLESLDYQSGLIVSLTLGNWLLYIHPLVTNYPLTC